MWDKKVIVLAIVVVLLFCLPGFVGRGAGAVNNGGSNSAREAVPIPEGLWEPYEQELVLTTVVAENSGTSFKDGDTYDNNPWYRAFKERFNISLTNLWVSNDYSTKLNLAIADRDLPDFCSVNAQQLASLEKSGLIMDLTELFETYASDTLKGYMEAERDTYETGCLGGRLYGIPQLSYGNIDKFDYVWIRKDWKDELGLADPQTMDDVIAIAKAFKENFGGYAMGEMQSLDNLNRLAVGFGAHPGIWVELEDGTLGYGTVQPEMKEVIATYAEWYKEGIINPDFTTTNQDKMFQDAINGDVGVIPFAQWFGYNPGPQIIENLGAEAIFEPYPIPSANGAEVTGSVKFGNNGYIVISKNCKNPEGVLKLINLWCYMMDDAAGNEDPEYITSLYDNNYPNCVHMLSVINTMTDYNQYVQVKETLAKGLDADATELGKNASKYNSCVAWLTEQDPDGVGDWLQQGNDKSAYGIAKEYLDNGIYLKDAKWGQDTATLQSVGSTLNDILVEGFTQIIIGEKDIDYFDTLVEEWAKAGGDMATAEINETYGNR